MGITKQVDKVVLRDRLINSLNAAELYEQLRCRLQKVHAEHLEAALNQLWVHFAYEGREGYWHSRLHWAVPVQSSYAISEAACFELTPGSLTQKLAVELFSPGVCPDEILKGIQASPACGGRHWIGFEGGSFCVENGRFANWNDGDSISISVYPLSDGGFKEAVLSGKYAVLSDPAYRQAVELLKERSWAELANAELDKLAQIYAVEPDGSQRDRAALQVLQKAESGEAFPPEALNLFIEDILASDYYRADLDKYDRKCLEDVNSGHWDLWYDQEPVADGGNKHVVKLEHPLVARNPVGDIFDNGLVGIDFGTKSTIVSVQNGHDDINLLRVGIGRLNKKTEAYHYENPTIMEFINLEKFMADYRGSAGRPETSVNDLRVSHTAFRELNACTDNSFFDSFFCGIKQWCGGDKDRTVIIKDQQKNSQPLELPPFLSLQPDDLNPLELYAYYLGIYINNMHEGGIYLDYVLSFPVNYSREVRQKILESFKAGIWKSLPEAVQNDACASKRYRVRLGVSEPAAYAITALLNYGFTLEEQDENCFYAIFDFGGGTTDFDFGIWRRANGAVREEEDRDYVIEHINSEGDRYLGGENLLELLAFEVFKANNDFMRTGRNAENSPDKAADAVGFSFALPNGFTGNKPSGCETTIRNSPSAKRNTRQLMEVLRPFWEGIIGVADAPSAGEPEAEGGSTDREREGTIVYNGFVFRNDGNCRFPISEDGIITVDLFDNNGQFRPGQKLYVDSSKKGISLNLVKILEDRIERGVNSFFGALELCMKNELARHCGADGVQIFLAGNSSKSPILMKLFNKYCQEGNREINAKGQDIEHFNIFPALGTAEAQEVQQRRGCRLNRDIVAPTGKTGVAYGLILGREGGPILVNSRIKAGDQATFQYNIGKGVRGRFHVVLNRNDVAYGIWKRFGTAGREDFEIYYTTLPRPGEKLLSDSGVRKVRCRIGAPDAQADIYVRTVEDAPEELEYCISVGEPAADAKVVRLHLKL